MKSLFNIALLILLTLTLSAQENGLLTNLKVPAENVQFKAIHHASMVFKINGKTIYVDPAGDASLYNGLEMADAILITDIHQDHLDIPAIRRLLHSETFFLAPSAVCEMMPDDLKGQCNILGNGEHINFASLNLKIKALPMYNLNEGEEVFHPKGRGNGYLLELADFSIYISGDTEDIPEMRALESIEIAFLCMNLPYTMSVEKAADAVLTFKPKVVYPYHYRNGDKSYSDVNKFTELVGKEGVECVLLDWYPNEQVLPE